VREEACFCSAASAATLFNCNAKMDPNLGVGVGRRIKKATTKTVKYKIALAGTQAQEISMKQNRLLDLEVSNDDDSVDADDQRVVTACQRASREARPPLPSASARALADEAALELFENLHMTNLFERTDFTRRSRVSLSPNKSARNTGRTQRQELQHLLALKSRNIESGNEEASWLVPSASVPLVHAPLVANALRSNAINVGVTVGKTTTMGATQQTTRVTLAGVSAAAAAQVVAIAFTLATARRECDDISANDPSNSKTAVVSNPAATNALNPASLVEEDDENRSALGLFAVTATSRLLLNALPTRLFEFSLLKTMRALAVAEKEHQYISERLDFFADEPIGAICTRILNVACGTAIWAAWSLIARLCEDPRGRRLLATTDLLDEDVQLSHCFLGYGWSEITRRARLKKAGNGAVNGDGHLSAAGDVCKTWEDGAEADERRTLSAKRKRGTSSTSTTNGRSSILEYWETALSSPFKSVLISLISNSKTAVARATAETLSSQSKDASLQKNRLLQTIAEKNATRSTMALRSLVCQDEENVPQVVAWTSKRGGNIKRNLGIVRSAEDSKNTVLMTASVGNSAVQPHRRAACCVVHCHSTQSLIPITDDDLLVPGVLEMHEQREVMHQGSGTHGPKGREARILAQTEEFLSQRGSRPLPLDVKGVTRSILVFDAKIVVHSSQIEIGARIGRKMAAQEGDWAKPKAMSMIKCTSFSGSLGLKKLMGDDNTEPIATPVSQLGLAVEANEAVRSMYKQKTRRGDACRVSTVAPGPTTASDISNATSDVLSSEPQPLLTIVDMNVEVPPNAEAAQPLRSRLDAKLADATVTLTVCGDDVIRIPEALLLVLKASSPAVAVREARALLYAGASAASEIGNVSRALLSGHTNGAIAASKRIAVADMKFLFLTPWQSYVGQLGNLQKSNEGTGWWGTCGPCIDTGSSGDVGIRAASKTADHRNHGKLLMDQADVDEYCKELGKRRYVQLDEECFAKTPPSTNGIPHGLYEGVHAALDNLTRGLSTVRRQLQIESKDTIGGVMALPLGPFAQFLPPFIQETADPTQKLSFRNRFESSTASGCAYQPDATVEDTAIIREPLFKRPCVLSAADNVFDSCHGHMDSFINAAASVALIARTLSSLCGGKESGDQQIKRLHDAMRRVTDRGVGGAPQDVLALDALLLLNCMYPTSWAIGEDTIQSAYAVAVGKAARGEAVQPLKERTKFFQAFCRCGDEAEAEADEICAWTLGVAPLLRELLSLDGTLKMDLDDYDTFRVKLEAAVRAAWLVHSPDGLAPPPPPCPASTAKSWNDVNGTHVDLVYFRREDGSEARGPLVGLLPCGYRQVLALMMGAHLTEVVVQYARNEGGLVLRPSSLSLAYKRTPDGTAVPRTCKAISPIQTEGDELAFGSRAAKEHGAVLQKKAWKRNVRLIMPLCVNVRSPLPKERRFAGDAVTVDEATKFRKSVEMGGRVSTEQREAEKQFGEASRALL